MYHDDFVDSGYRPLFDTPGELRWVVSIYGGIPYGGCDAAVLFYLPTLISSIG